MNRPTVFVTRIIPERGLAMIHEHCDVSLWEDELPPPQEVILREIATVDGILSLLTDKIDAAVMDTGRKLRVISNMAVGYDNIDIPAATARGLPVGHTPGVLTETTADFAFALLMASARRIVEGERYIKAGKWKTWGPMTLTGPDIYGATLGLIGFGRIGQAVAQRAQGFGMKLLYYDPVNQTETAQKLGAEKRPLADVLRESDFVSLHLPYSPETHHFIGEAQLRQMKPSAILINTARGGIVNPQALYNALRGGTIAAAALDVTDPEPIPVDDPLLTLDNCLIVPHIASASIATREKMAVMAAENLLAGLTGSRMPNCVNPAIYDSAR